MSYTTLADNPNERRSTLQNHIFILCGPSQSGKSTLIKEVFFDLYKDLDIVRSSTTRPKRDDDDDWSYDFMSEETFILKERRGDFIETTGSPRSRYGYEKKIVDSVLADKNGICAADQNGIKKLQEAGYPVVPIRIVPFGNQKLVRDFYDAHPGREEWDRKRAEIPVLYHKEIVNPFVKGGFQEAKNNLSFFILENIHGFTDK